LEPASRTFATACRSATAFTNPLTAARRGSTWVLKDSERISAIAIHPQNPDIVYIGALGHAFGPNEERGVFKTTDGGKTWAKTLYIDNQHGVADSRDSITTTQTFFTPACGA
jgi:hypothetical protein